MTKPAVHISNMTGKLDGLRAISTNTRTNTYCVEQHERAVEHDTDNICGKCYSHACSKASVRTWNLPYSVTVTCYRQDH